MEVSFWGLSKLAIVTVRRVFYSLIASAEFWFSPLIPCLAIVESTDLARSNNTLWPSSWATLIASKSPVINLSEVSPELRFVDFARC